MIWNKNWAARRESLFAFPTTTTNKPQRRHSLIYLSSPLNHSLRYGQRLGAACALPLFSPWMSASLKAVKSPLYPLPRTFFYGIALTAAVSLFNETAEWVLAAWDTTCPANKATKNSLGDRLIGNQRWTTNHGTPWKVWNSVFLRVSMITSQLNITMKQTDR